VPTLAAGFIACFAGTFVFQEGHRWRHESLPWRVFHRILRSARRIGVVTSFYERPAEMIVDSIIGSAPCCSLSALTNRMHRIHHHRVVGHAVRHEKEPGRAQRHVRLRRSDRAATCRDACVAGRACRGRGAVVVTRAGAGAVSA
jgi:hypothetical protein